MTKKLKTGVAQMVANARSAIEEIDAKDMLDMIDNGAVVIVDIRDIRERQRGFIPNSFHCPRGMVEFWVDPESPYYKEIFGEDKKFIFHCASGWRSALTTQILQEMGMDNIAHMKDGFMSWKDAGGTIEFPDKRN
ncbi:rhodanese-like domain-containing protein [Marinomonas colpomeniae]|uniref:Rhodanese-like domain-containing protein n=1 Tax=Marinomonas colpomeniae TaxID=2774408 RepID=A0ABR8P3H2_9GAMM|nr:rhodanese-like domain-containing protein [Marinomonas colpomeniae]MBD5772344.1 rhodanese-like domain-containing protein [Marinomonas colpomeniae]